MAEGNAAQGAETIEGPAAVTLLFVRALPKAEVHVHLEGCTTADDIEELARAAGQSLPRPRERLFEFGSLGPS